MKSVLLCAFIFILTLGVSYAEQTQQPSESAGAARAKYIQYQGMSKYSRMLESILDAAEDMEITVEQKEKIAKIRVDYLAPMVTDEIKFARIHTKIMKMVEDPAFDAGSVKKEVENADALNKKTADNYIDGLAALRDTLGPEKYTDLNKSAYRYRHDMIQLRKKQLQEQRSRSRSVDTETPHPETDTDTKDTDSEGSVRETESKE